jgi:transposase
MKYTISDFHKEFPDEESCVQKIFSQRYGSMKVCPKCKKSAAFYRIKNRKSYSCQFCGYQIAPLAGTIFHKSPTPLKLWFYAIYLFSASRNGVSAKELQRQLGVTYKTAWRIAKQVRALMGDNNENDKLSGIVEVDETLIGGTRRMDSKMKNKSSVMGMVEREGRIKAIKIEDRSNFTLLKKINEHIAKDSKLVTDEWPAYRVVSKYGYKHRSVVHGRKQYARGMAHTNTIEGFWGQLKRSISGTYHSVSKEYLQSYVDEFAWRYNHRDNAYPIFLSLLEGVWRLAQ